VKHEQEEAEAAAEAARIEEERLEHERKEAEEAARIAEDERLSEEARLAAEAVPKTIKLHYYKACGRA